jgi:hypothetical protein
VGDNYLEIVKRFYKEGFFILRMVTNELMRKKVNYFYKKKIPVHITKKNGFFNNGKILKVAKDMMILEDEVNGASPIYFIEILEIEKRKEKVRRLS